MIEEWKPVVGYEGKYEVSSHGRVRSLPRQATPGKIRKLQPLKDGYKRVSLCKGGVCVHKRVHRLVLEAFVGECPEGMVACHLDSKTSNNILDNLEWDTHKNNTADVIARGRFYYIRGKKEAELNAA